MMSLSRPQWGRILILSISFFALFSEVAGAFEKEVYDCNAAGNREVLTTIDLKLSKKYKKQKAEIREEVKASNETMKVRLAFFPFLDPPMNLAIGKCVSAEEGRLAIKTATTYNRGVGFLVMQELLPHHWVRIGLTDLAELAWVPVAPEDMARLSDPALSTEAFQSVYRELATLKERKLPFGMGTKQIEAAEGK